MERNAVSVASDSGTLLPYCTAVAGCLAGCHSPNNKRRGPHTPHWELSLTADGITGTTTTVVTIGTSTRVLVDLETEVEWTGSWFAYAYAWCAVWGPKGRRINAPSGAATAMATITFEREYNTGRVRVGRMDRREEAQ